MSNFSLIVTTEKKGHYAAYGEVIKALYHRNGLESRCVLRLSGIMEGLKARRLVLVDGDSRHLTLVPLIIMRSLLGRLTVMLSVRTEDLLESRWKSKIKAILFRFLKALPGCHVVSIHKGKHELLLDKYVSNFIYDIQLWDLPLLSGKEEMPVELAEKKYSDYCLVLGGLNYKRNVGDVIAFAKANPDIYIIVAGGKSDADAVRDAECVSNLMVIDRYISDEEINWLYRNSKYVWAMYSKYINRPSGMLGRALQNNKFVLVREGGYLFKEFKGDYRCVALSDANYAVPKNLHQINDDGKKYNDMNLLEKIIIG